MNEFLFCYSILKPHIKSAEMFYNQVYNTYISNNYDLFMFYINEIENKSNLANCLKLLTDYDNYESSKYVDAILELMPLDNYLHVVAHKQNHVFDYMLDSYNNIMTTNKSTALHIACENSCFENVKKLVQTYKFIDDRDERGYTPFMISIKKHNNEIFTYLLDNGASQNVTDNYGNTPLHLAVLDTFITAINKLTPHNNENNFRMTPQDYINNMMKSYFYHARTFKEYQKQLGYVSSTYNCLHTKNIPRVIANINNVNLTVEKILEKVNNGYNINDII